MTRAGKVWGWTSPIWQGGGACANLIYVKAGGFCSEHRHAAKYNLFYNLSFTGKLIVKIWQGDYELVDVTELGHNESLVVKPGLYHQFRADGDLKALEFYWGECREDDIERRTVGGV